MHFYFSAFQTHHKLCNDHLDVPHILFDYHQEVKSGDSKNLSKLKNKVQKYVEKFGFFTLKGSDITREQFGTVRTNCTDCLDRTNCVQTYLGLEVLKYALMDLGLTDKPNIVSRFEEYFKTMWVNNGNELSKMYAGTGAIGNAGSKVIHEFLFEILPNFSFHFPNIFGVLNHFITFFRHLFLK